MITPAIIILLKLPFESGMSRLWTPSSVVCFLQEPDKRRYCSEKSYEEFKNKIMKSENQIFIKTEVKINSIRGEF